MESAAAAFECSREVWYFNKPLASCDGFPSTVFSQRAPQLICSSKFTGDKAVGQGSFNSCRHAVVSFVTVIFVQSIRDTYLFRTFPRRLFTTTTWSRLLPRTIGRLRCRQLNRASRCRLRLHTVSLPCSEWWSNPFLRRTVEQTCPRCEDHQSLYLNFPLSDILDYFHFCSFSWERYKRSDNVMRRTKKSENIFVKLLRWSPDHRVVVVRT